MSTPTPPPGHLGNLTPEQQNALDTVKRVLPDELKKLGKEPGDDHELLRFLRAHKFDVQKMMSIYVNYMNWRQTLGVDDFKSSIPFKADKTRVIAPGVVHGFDREGRPCMIQKIGKIYFQLLAANFTDDQMARIHIWVQEMLSQKAREMSEKLGRNVDNFCHILDLEGIDFSMFKNMRFHKTMQEIDAMFYPERSGRIYIVNAPWVVGALWSLLGPWIDPGKTLVLKGDPKVELLKYFEPDQLPAEYGGTCDGRFDCHFHPDCVKTFTPEEAAKCLARDESTMKFHTENIGSKKKFTQRLEGKAGTTFSWYWKVANGDMAFTAEFHPSLGRPFPVCSTDKFEAGVPVQGEYTATKDGAMLFIFDNEHSWFKSKTLTYTITTAVEEPKAEAMPESKEAAAAPAEAATTEAAPAETAEPAAAEAEAAPADAPPAEEKASAEAS